MIRFCVVALCLAACGGVAYQGSKAIVQDDYVGIEWCFSYDIVWGETQAPVYSCHVALEDCNEARQYALRRVEREVLTGCVEVGD